jgi:type VI secretion system secreted protein Hcp
MCRCRASSVARSVLSVALLAACGFPAAAATYAWLDFDGAISGESTDKVHKDWIEIQSYGFDARRDISSGTGGSREAGRPQLAEVTLTKRLDRASPPLFAAAVAGHDPYPRVKLDLNTGSSQPLVRLELENVFVSGQSFAAVEGEDRPSESITLNFTKITYTYVQPDSQTLYTSYDLVTGAAESNAGEVTPPNPDSDNDGMLDSWELTYGLSVGVNDAAGDADGDGLSNLDEFQLGTHPKLGTSFFKATLAGVPATPGSYQLSWNSVVGKTYVIEWTATLGTPFSTVRAVTATATTSTESVTPAGTMGFYRVRPQ